MKNSDQAMKARKRKKKNTKAKMDQKRYGDAQAAQARVSEVEGSRT
jgi:hypothetical protein